MTAEDTPKSGTALTHMIATVGGVGHLKPAPGTWGSLAALPLAWVVNWIGGAWLFLVLLVLIILLGWWATAREIAGQDNKDPGEIVVDELAGQWIALLPVILGADMMGIDVLRLYPGWIVAFLAFRAFDIRKPWLVGRMDRRKGATGVMADDLVAGAMAAIVVVIAAAIGHAIMFMS